METLVERDEQRERQLRERFLRERQMRGGIQIRKSKGRLSTQGFANLKGEDRMPKFAHAMILGR